MKYNQTLIASAYGDQGETDAILKATVAEWVNMARERYQAHIAEHKCQMEQGNAAGR